MSYWGATVITNFLSVVPVIGNSLVVFIWGRYSVGRPTLSRFFSFHFLLPFILLGVMGLHMVLLHIGGSGNPLGTVGGHDKSTFYPLFTSKDLVGFVLPSVLIVVFVAFPWVFMEYQNFIESNPFLTPTHIQPEWYFLYTYCVLRAVPSKLGGVLVLVASLVVLFIFPFVRFKLESAY
jgi:ubiquinol-cytochrome c reductase cytochrome b subunit